MKATPSFILVTLMVVLLASAGSIAELEKPLPSQGARPGEPLTQTEEERAIRAMIEAFVIAFDNGNASAVAGLFAGQGEAVALDGNMIRGRDALQAHYADRFASSPGDTLKTEIELIHFLAADVARQDGRSKIFPADGSLPGSYRYTATLIKEERAWKIASLRELEDLTITHNERLKELDWMVGDWVEETGDAFVATSVGWADEGNFLLRSFEVRVQGKPTLKGTQRIGWDPLTKQIKSWVFDSRGAYGEGYWNRSGERWIVKSTGVRPDGQMTSATQILTRVNKDRIRWKSTDRTLGGETRDDIEEFVMVRKPPEPQ